MPSLVTLRGYLGRAETNITEGEIRISRQTARLEDLRLTGRDTLQAGTLLKEMKRTLKAWRDERATILRTIAKLEAAPDT